MPVERIAIVSEVPALTLAELEPVVAALQKQIDDDFAPIWGVAAEIIAVAPGQAPPAGAWTLTVKGHFEAHGMSGLHYDTDGNPWAVIAHGSDWTLAASHELLEMLVDPLADRIISGPSPHGEKNEVHILVEVCDPCQEANFAYEIDGVSVSDFLTPSYYEPDAPAGTRFSFQGSITAPFQLLEGGYITWQDPATLILHQVHWPVGGRRGYRELGPVPDLVAEQPRLREWVDGETLRLGMPGSPHPH
jgi:hypothetical protein